jgi:hypothetical protein
LLKCYKGICGCDSVWEYYNTNFKQCLPKINESQPCSSSEQCLGNMECNVNQTCSCDSYHYFETFNYTCIEQVLDGKPCIKNITCREDLGFLCSTGGECTCDTRIQFWNSSSSSCEDYYTYGDIGCLSDSDCDPSQSLVCNKWLMSYSCNCPNTSYVSMCDCPRTFGNESYWNSTLCVPAGGVGSPCNKDYECQTITQGLACLNKTCSKICEGNWSYFEEKCYQIFPANGGCTSGCDVENIKPKCVNQNSQGTSQLAILSTDEIFYFTRSMDPDPEKKYFSDAYIGGYWANITQEWKWINGNQIITNGSLSVWCGNIPNSGTNQGSMGVSNPAANAVNADSSICVRISTTLDCYKNNVCEDDQNFICEYTA